MGPVVSEAEEEEEEEEEEAEVEGGMSVECGCSGATGGERRQDFLTVTTFYITRYPNTHDTSKLAFQYAFPQFPQGYCTMWHSH